MAVPVDIFVTSDDLTAVALEGVQVSLFTLNPLTLRAQGLTDSDGRAGFVVPGGLYELRLYKLGVVFGAQRGVLVEEPLLTTNTFDVTGTLLTLPLATDPRLCRCTGRFVTLDNRPISGMSISIMQKGEAGFQVPKIVDGNMVSAQKLVTKTNQNGLATIDLFRGGQYYVTFSGEEDTVWNVKVPDRPSANLIELIHPTPVSLSWDGEVGALTPGGQVFIPVSVLFSDYELITEGLSRWITLTSSDTNVATVSFSGNVVCLTGVRAGSCLVTAGLAASTTVPARVPAPSLLAQALVVTVA
jgi:hypothetical protein